MLVLGQGALIVALLAAAWSLGAGILGGITNSPGLAKSSGRGLVAGFVLLSLSVAGLLHAIITNNFAVQYVADYSNRAQPLPYKFSALWAGMGGSLLFWAFVLAGFSAAVVMLSRRALAELVPWVYAVLGGTLLFFVAVSAFVSNPFAATPAGAIPVDGVGMNPLLQNPWMMIHPPTLYLGYVGCTVPFAFALAALFSGRLDQSWVRSIRRWSLFAFACLTLGIWLGGYWAYIELGWGGFWAWDAVENASLMPWLVLTAFVHSVIVQDRRGMFKVWNMFLVFVTFLLCVYGTFLTRSGIIQSVHAFNKSSIGNWFLGYMALAAVLSIGFLIYRWGRLSPDGQVESIVSREAALLLGTFFLLFITGAVWYMTMYPVFSQWFTGNQISLEPPTFTSATKPFFLFVVLLMGIAPLAGWRRAADAKDMLRGAAIPAAIALVLTVTLALLGAHEPWSLAYFWAAFFVFGVVGADVRRMIRARREITDDSTGRSFAKLLVAQRRRFGAYVSHVSVGLMVIGVVASMTYQKQKLFEVLTPGQTVEADGYRITYKGVDAINRPDYDGAAVKLDIVRPGGSSVESVAPERRVYGRTRQPSAEVAILSTVLPPSFSALRRTGEDLYIIPQSIDLSNNQVSIEVLVHPMVNWLWLGGVLLLCGTIIAAWPERREPEFATVTAAPGTAPLPSAR